MPVPKLLLLLLPWLALAISVCAMSSGGVWFALLQHTPPVTRVCWRLTLTAAMQAPVFMLQLQRADDALRKKWWQALPQMSAVGAVLALHFATWSVSIAMTSLTHSLLFVSTTPLLIVAYAGCIVVIVRALRLSESRTPTESDGTDLMAASSIGGDEADLSTLQDTPDVDAAQSPASIATTPAAPPAPSTLLQRVTASLVATQAPTLLEWGGTLLGFAAAVALAQAAAAAANSGSGSSSSHSTQDVEPSVAGDAVATVGAAAMGVYLAVGGSLRAWMPSFMYACPVTAAAAVAAGIAALMLESPAHESWTGPGALFGWMTSDTSLLLPTLAGAGVSGILGHTLAIVSLSHIRPLIVALVLLSEPLVGSLLGAAMGVQELPDAITLACGPVLIIAAAMVTVGGKGSPADVAVQAAIRTGMKKCCGARE